MRCLVLIAYLHASGTRRGSNTRRYHSEMPVGAPLVGKKLSGALFPLGFCRERGSIVSLSIQVHGSRRLLVFIVVQTLRMPGLNVILRDHSTRPRAGVLCEL